LTKIILKKKQKENFGKKIQKKKHKGKAKAKFSTSSTLKKIKFNKDNLKKNHVEKYCTKRKIICEKYCSNL